MCGITGIMKHAPINEIDSLEFINGLNHLYHRGPDSGGHWMSKDRKLMLGHRRLAILDLTSAGHQPMVSDLHGTALSFNGEIYNHVKIRERLNRVDWRSDSDTETLLMAFSKWGVERTLSECEGMFAFAFYSQEDESLTLGRDRLGEKPLYYGVVEEKLVFSSELSSFKNYKDFKREFCNDSIKAYFKYSYVPFPKTIYKGVYKLEPGTILKITTDKGAFKFERSPYWSFANLKKDKSQVDELEAKSNLKALLEGSVVDQLNADVPIGAFLSGGIDSSLVVSIASRVAKKRVKTYTIGFENSESDESKYALEIANQLKTDHNELILENKILLEEIPSISSIYDEPFGDSSQVPTYLVSRITKEHVTVALSGDGGDELFGGYERYLQGGRLWKNYERFGFLQHFAPPVNDFLKNLSPSSLLTRTQTFNRFKDSEIHDFKDFYRNVIVSHDLGVRFLSKSILNAPSIKESRLNHLNLDADPQSMMDIDLLTYLPDDLLYKVDRSSMAVSLETRAPFLNHKVVEFASCLPLRLKVNKGESKYLLKKLLEDYLPKELFMRPKQGFGLPVAELIRGPLRTWALSLIDRAEVLAPNVFDINGLKKVWSNFLEGNNKYQTNVWDVLMFLSWIEKNHK